MCVDTINNIKNTPIKVGSLHLYLTRLLCQVPLDLGRVATLGLVQVEILLDFMDIIDGCLIRPWCIIGQVTQQN